MFLPSEVFHGLMLSRTKILITLFQQPFAWKLSIINLFNRVYFRIFWNFLERKVRPKPQFCRKSESKINWDLNCLCLEATLGPVNEIGINCDFYTVNKLVLFCLKKVKIHLNITCSGF